MNALRFVVIASLLWACGDDSQDAVKLDSGPVAPDAALGGTGADGGGGSDAAPPSVPPPGMTPTGMITCGTEMCTVPMGVAAYGVQPCCAGKNKCGQTNPLMPDMCFAVGQPGHIDLSCPPYDVAGITTWPGCCTPDGECGGLNAGQNSLGCVSNGDLGATEQSCDYDPKATCTRILQVACDGPEDCPKGKMCCGHFNGGGYREFSCEDDCAALDAADGSMADAWSEICHPGQKCAVDTYTCQANEEFLPDFLYRCRDTGTKPGAAGSKAKGEINCGDSVCGAGQKCCISAPEGAPYCGDKDEACRCNTSGDLGHDGGVDDAG